MEFFHKLSLAVILETQLLKNIYSTQNLFMRHNIFILSIITLLLSCGQNDTKQKELELKEREIAVREKELALKQRDSLNKQNAKITESQISNDTKTEVNSNKEKTKEEKWEIFWTDFKNSFNAKDKAKIAALTSKEFDCSNCSGSDIYAWLNEIAFFNNGNFNTIKKMLNGRVKNIKSKDFGDCKATGNGGSGEFYFIYKDGKWLFRAIMGD